MTSLGTTEGTLYSKLLRINSSKAFTNGRVGYSPSNCIVDLGQNCQKVRRVSFISVVFSNTAYNILNGNYSDQSNVFRWRSHGYDTGRNGFLLKGFYNTTQLMAAIQTEMNRVFTINGHGETATLTQDPISNLVTITYDSGSVALQFGLLDNLPTDGFSVWKILGFTVPVYTESKSVGTATFTAPNVPNLAGLKQAYLRSSTLSPGNEFDEKGKLSDVCINIPVTAPFGSLNVWECKVDKLCEIIYSTPRNFQQIDFALVDEDGSVIELNGSTVRIELKIFFDKY